MKQKVITFGELMLRLSPPGYQRFLQTERYEATFGGAEANVAVSLAIFGLDVNFVTKLPEHEIGQSVVNALRRYGVGTQWIIRGGHRVGSYFVEKGASQRPSKVIYDRAHSAIAEANPGEFDWERIFDQASWFHFTGITPALSPQMAAACLAACQVARAKGIPISCDLNYRKNLWSREQARLAMTKLAPYIDLCIANEEDAADVFGIHAEASDIQNGELSQHGYESVARQLVESFGFKKVAITLRESISANDNNWSAIFFDGQTVHASRMYPVHIVDRVGGGDSFGAGLIYAQLTQMSAQDSIEFAVAASCLKHAIEGDFNLVSLDEVRRLAGGDASGRVQR